MLTAFILLAAMDAAPAPVVLVGRTDAGTTRTLSDVAAERRLGIRPPGTGTFSVTGATGMPILLSPVYGEGGSFAAVDSADATRRPGANASQPVAGWPYLITGYGYNWQARHAAPRHGQRVAPPAPSPHAHATRGAGKRPH